MHLIDSHSHIYDPEFDNDRTDVISRARQAGVEHILLPAVDRSSHDAMFTLADSDPLFFHPMIGLHPTSVNDNPNYIGELKIVEKLLRDTPDRFCAIGEVGLDLHWSAEWAKQQREVLERQIELALEFRKPLVLHVRDAWPQIFEVLDRYRNSGLSGVMHAFSGTYEHYSAALEIGDFVFGIGGVVTYKKSTIAELLPRMSLTHIVLETDSPYLTPTPFRGKRNESAHVVLVCNKVAELLELSPDEVATATTNNAHRIFGV